MGIIHVFIRWLLRTLVSTFYARIEVHGRENLPDSGAIFISNHPNGLIDPLLLIHAFDRPISFLAKSTLFIFPLNVFVNAFAALPIFRKRDDGKWGGPTGDAKERNEQTFERCRQLLRDGGFMALFPEGTTHSEPSLLPLRTGAARIALSTESGVDWNADLSIVPVGLWYQRKSMFRSEVLIVVGRPFQVDEYAADYQADARKTVRRLTDDLKTALDAVVLQAEDQQILSALPRIAAWLAPQNIGRNLPEKHTLARRLLDAYHRLGREDPGYLQHLITRINSYTDSMELLGVTDPWSLETPHRDNFRLVLSIVLLGITAPIAAFGLLINYVPYRLARPTARAVVGYDLTQVSTIKAVSGFFYLLGAWTATAVVLYQFVGWWCLLFIFPVGPWLAYATLRWLESVRALRRVARHQWLRLRQGDRVRMLVAQRQALAQEIVEGLDEVGESV